MMDSAPAGKMLVETLAAALRVHIMRHYSNLESALIALPKVRGALDARRLERVTEFIDTHLGTDLSIEALAEQAHLSPFHFARAFKSATGAAPHRYLIERRVGRAKALLAEGRLPLAAIARSAASRPRPTSRAGSSVSWARLRGSTGRVSVLRGTSLHGWLPRCRLPTVSMM